MFHWICPECGREIPPSVRECQACDPNAAPLPVVEPIKPERLLDASPVAHLISVAPEPVADLTPIPSEPSEPVLETRAAEPITTSSVEPRQTQVVLETHPATEVSPNPPSEKAAAQPVVPPVAEPVKPVPTDAVVERTLPIEEPVIAAPAPAPPAMEPRPFQPEAISETLPREEAFPHPVVDAAPAATADAPQVLAEGVAPEPVIEEAPVQLILDTLPTPEVALPELVVAQAVEPDSPPLPEISAVPEPAVALPLPAEANTPVPAPQVEPIKLEDVPDPLLALAEEIRAAQAARAIAISPPAPAAGLLPLAEAVGVQEPELKQEQATVRPELAVEPADPFSKTQKLPIPYVPEEATIPAEAVTALALLARPEPLAVHELRPAPLAPEPQSEPLAVALAPEPQPEGPTLPLAPMQEYKPATSRSIQPVPPKAQILAADSGPRITLPGPTLPPELTRLQDANVVTMMGEATAERTKEAIPSKSAGAPGWLVSVLVMLLLLATCLGIVFYLMPHTVADAKPAPTPAVAATAPAPTGGTSPLAKFVEVTGFRIVTSIDANKKSEVQYLVVNHSDADISDANVFVTLRSAKPGQAPVCRFSFKVPSLGPFESKEMSSPIEKATRAISLPDWQDLRAEVQISQ
jgi:hypothetical protein